MIYLIVVGAILFLFLKMLGVGIITAIISSVVVTYLFMLIVVAYYRNFSSYRYKLSSYRVKPNLREVEVPVSDFQDMALSVEWDESLVDEDIHSVYMCHDKIEDGKKDFKRSYGGYIFMDAKHLRENRRLIAIDSKLPEEERSYGRNDTYRSNAYIPGSKEFKNTFHETSEGRQYMWHRTHGIPYRYVLDEGLFTRGLLFWGTARLNSGARPDLNSFVSDEEHSSHAEELFQLYMKNRKSNGRGGLFVDGTEYKGRYYNLDDIERFADKIIERYSNNVFKYAFLLSYKPGSDIPEYVLISLSNMSQRRKEFSIVVYNKF